LYDYEDLQMINTYKHVGMQHTKGIFRRLLRHQSNMWLSDQQETNLASLLGTWHIKMYQIQIPQVYGD
jgi:hypothetical protein